LVKLTTTTPSVSRTRSNSVKTAAGYWRYWTDSAQQTASKLSSSGGMA
jgi:hypothetical protein